MPEAQRWRRKYSRMWSRIVETLLPAEGYAPGHLLCQTAAVMFAVPCLVLLMVQETRLNF